MLAKSAVIVRNLILPVRIMSGILLDRNVVVAQPSFLYLLLFSRLFDGQSVDQRMLMIPATALLPPHHLLGSSSVAVMLWTYLPASYCVHVVLEKEPLAG